MLCLILINPCYDFLTASLLKVLHWAGKTWLANASQVHLMVLRWRLPSACHSFPHTQSTTTHALLLKLKLVFRTDQLTCQFEPSTLPNHPSFHRTCCHWVKQPSNFLLVNHDTTSYSIELNWQDGILALTISWTSWLYYSFFALILLGFF